MGKAEGSLVPRPPSTRGGGSGNETRPRDEATQLASPVKDKLR